ncbi:MAG TPA: shikimate dehydrogenase [Spirochaetota bacterium]|nr:shikimate dehydrogenase [Spirochaetota bacterium]
MKPDAHTILYCLFGRPARHSLSPAMHNAAFEHLGMNAVYLAFEPEKPLDAVRAMRALGIRGASITIPFKTDILDHIDEIDPLAEKIGSVNTLINDDGIIKGFNTDGHGAVRALLANGVSISGRKTLVVGNGGSARAIAFSLLEEKAEVTISGRNEKNAGALASDLSRYFKDVKSCRIDSLTNGSLDEYQILINTTPVGMFPDIGSSPIDPSLLRPGMTVFDIVYAPARTRLLGSAESAGCRIVFGTEMLLYQGARQFELWTSGQAPVETMRDALIRNMKNRQKR